MHVMTPLRDKGAVNRTSRAVAECVVAELIATYTPAKPVIKHKGRWIYFLVGLSVGATCASTLAVLLLWRFN